MARGPPSPSSPSPSPSSSSGTASARRRRTPTASSTSWCSAGSASPIHAGPRCAWHRSPASPICCLPSSTATTTPKRCSRCCRPSPSASSWARPWRGPCRSWPRPAPCRAPRPSPQRGREAAGSISALDSDAVLAGVVDTLVGLGFEAANLCIFDDATDTYTVAQPRGLPRPTPPVRSPPRVACPRSSASAGAW